MNKSDLRLLYRKKRADLSIEDIETKSLDISNQLLKLDIWDHSFYHIFLTISEQKEINTDYILNILSGKDKNIIISKSNFKTGKMTHFLLTDNTVIKKNDYNIPEPVDGIEIPSEKIEVVFVPLLAFDKVGHRIGYGKGFYDLFLSECKPETIKIGLSFFEAEEKIEGVFDSDIALDYCVTPAKIYRF
ncbi:5-formyltetrahydrofolate cyclo-ligase [Subsaxibacter sp. CAU 1640]|uniref:5-formyltetrahydrofolate cyclo-ligase n=1 Tax=Subsaxibacter sp. CAU 1640 TaxID=2933271 RepID=UPI002004A2A1|nr:5-formyltetrahydrofolate cyclo-ligase [Subsaxibacter sp. CAU 1640]MCK7589724.1 5-formyltetrahydrofolate cyclo-ligase [Subsaxibacter sp. CAU 1640]